MYQNWKGMNDTSGSGALFDLVLMIDHCVGKPGLNNDMLILK